MAMQGEPSLGRNTARSIPILARPLSLAAKAGTGERCTALMA